MRPLLAAAATVIVWLPLLWLGLTWLAGVAASWLQWGPRYDRWLAVAAMVGAVAVCTVGAYGAYVAPIPYPFVE